MALHPTIGVLTPLVGGFYYANILAGVQRAARRRGARVVAFQTTGMDLLWPDEPGGEPLAWNSIDGFIGVNDLEARAYCSGLLGAERPLVTLSARLGDGSTAVMPENLEGTLQAVRHLVAHGHRRIAFAGTLNQLDLAERFEGYQQALREAGIEPDPELFFEMTCTLELEGRATGRRMVAAGVPFTALVACTDLNAIGIMRELQAAGYRVPEDVALVGFDDIEAARYMDPPLATVRQSFGTLAETACDVLLDRIVLGQAMPREVRVPTVLIPRHSCGCVSHGISTVSLSRYPSDKTRSRALTELLQRFFEQHAQVVPNDLDERAWPSAERLAEHVADVASGRQGLPKDQLTLVWREFLQVAHDVESVEGLMSLVEDASQRWLKNDAANDTRALHVRAKIRELRFEFMREWRSKEQARRRYYDSITEANRKINLALIGADLESARSLKWLAWARVDCGWLGEWQRASSTANRQLAIVSVFDEFSGSNAGLGLCHAPCEFPSKAMLDRLEGEADNILTLIPLTSSAENRGILAVVGPVETEVFDDTGTLGQWAALLAAAMDREDLLKSLREGFERERRIAKTLRESEERYALAARAASDGLWDWNIVTGEFYFSPRHGAILGLEERAQVGGIEDWFQRVHPDDLVGLKAALEAHLSGASAHIEHEYRIVVHDGSQRWVLCRGIAVFDDAGKPVRAAGSQTDITARKTAEEQLRNASLQDTLTGLPNRALLIDRLDQALRRSRREVSSFATLMMDLDHFKTINDGLGPGSGDQLLVQIATRLARCTREADTVARLGGDEFAMVVSDVASLEEAMVVADRVHEALKDPFDIQGHRVFTSASIGIVLSSAHYEQAEDLLRDADTAMSRAKTRGRARHELFDARMHDQALERLSIEAGLRRALEHNELILFYQPIVSLRTGAVLGVEALLRWQHPERGLLAPDSFLALAEEAGLSQPIGEWVLFEATRQSRAWQPMLSSNVRISINVAPEQLKEPGLPTLVERALASAGVEASAIGVELVESSLIDSSERVVRSLQALKEMGVLVAVDDFGTGYSSLSYLKKFPIDYLKIDRSFVQGVPGDANDTAISTAIIAMARSLNLAVVAEGVESRQQVEFLRTQSCDLGQGYYFSRPLAPEQCLAFLRHSDIKNLDPTGTQ